MAAPRRSYSRQSAPDKTVLKAAKRLHGRIKKADIAALCPELNRTALDKAIRQLVSNGTLVRYGTGRSTFYVRADEET